MRNLSEAPVHPGTYVRRVIIPSDMSVKEAAERLGIGRPALSNFLNGKSSLSPKMAVRLEKAFGADRKKLLELQVAYNQKLRVNSEKEIAVRAFVPTFLTIKARQIEEWANSRIEARHNFPVLLRKLVHSTSNGLRQIDFPGYDNAQRKGNDGYVEAEVATPWVPEGSSYWEFGTDKNPIGKAESDYTARLKSIESSVRTNSSFIFVTPRNWHGKKVWEEQKNRAGDWKLVRAFDASDLEQWLEQSVSAQIWLTEQLGLPVKGFETLEQAWSRWANASHPPITPEIFSPSVTASRDKLKTWLNKPSNSPLVVTADSSEEALAFLACVFSDAEFCQFKDQAAIFTSPEPLRTLISSFIPFIPIVYSESVERELADAQRRLHCIVYRPRNAVDTEADIKLDLLSHEVFKNALVSMKIEEDHIERLERESGRSPTILRRRLSQNTALRTPVWASDDRAEGLVPIALVGAWHADTEADRKIISNIANREYDSIEINIARLLQLDDSPVWSVGHYRGVASKIDALFAIAKMVTPADISRFFVAAEYVLSETDPALELPEKDRWAAAIYDKTRDHSSALRTGICETLVILSVHGNNLFQSRLGVDIEIQVSQLIRKLLTPLTLEKLFSHNRDLPRYAEAAPDEFIKIVEEDLRSINPVVFGLLKPVDSSLFGVSPSRTGLLWGLECLAWKPQNLPVVSQILAKLSRLKIDDNWANKPESSLQAIFRSWMPQTAASVEQRMKVLEMLTKRFPDVGWEICIEQIKPGSRIGHYSYRPNWRNDASGAGQVVSRQEMYEFNQKALDLIIAWPSHNENTLGDVIGSLEVIPEEDQIKVWNLIDEWSQSADDSTKAELREKIRLFAFTRRSRHRKLGEETRNYARDAYERLQPKNLVIRHRWLFADHWVQESIEDIEEDFDYQKREERIDRLRSEAINEIWTGLKFQGIKELISFSGAAGVIGRYVSFCVIGMKPRVDFIKRCLSLDGDIRSKADWFVQGFLSAIEDDSRIEILKETAEKLTGEERIRLFTCAPFQTSTWHLLDRYGEDTHIGYWKEVLPSWSGHTPAEFTELIDCLLEAKRPRAAFHAAQMNFKDIETSRLKRLLRDVVTINEEPKGHYRLDSYYISKALSSLNGRVDVNSEEMAQLEFLFIDALDDSEYGIPNLERQVAEMPVVFVQAVALAYKRGDDGEDPPEWGIQNPENQVAVASAAHRLLDRVRMIPGTDENGKVDAVALASWLTEVRRLCRECGRADIGDQCLGQLLSRSPVTEGGSWPSEEVCEAMEGIASQQVGKGFYIGVRNSRGVHWRGEGGEQERQLATRYHAMAERLYFDYPYVGGILEDIAKSYEHDARWQDSESNISNRLRY
ncbi:HigA family addiction module antitoxin [Paenibacillus sp. O199]|uniref:HigA family addiction module antitoxin n=1 Tax=Paenibacillus sp. O199 TaxID=1643925 RepID=UPI000A9C5063|nr:HigA family addiction module antitoxin [Paenibacillus sp. O199]